MGNMRALRARVRSLESTQQITKSMKMVAASKLRRTQNAYSRLKEYAEKSSEILGEVLACMKPDDNPFLLPRETQKTVCYVLFLGNRGLCGGYHQALLHELGELTEETHLDVILVTCGRWGKEAVQKTGFPLRYVFDQIGDVPTAEEADAVSDALMELYCSGQADEVVLVYQQYKSALQQVPCGRQLLPVRPEYGMPEGTEYIFEPDRKMLLNTMVDQYIRNTVYAALLEAKTSEHSARMTAMTAASDNTDELIDRLQLQMNRERQAAITTELSEISGGASSLNRDRS